jgi:hypothetical protein
MTSLFKKMNFKDHEAIFAIQAPESFLPELKEMGQLATVKSSMKGAKTIPFLIAFVTKQKEVDDLAVLIGKLVKADEVIWFAYPKGTSKKYTCEFNRDNGWKTLGKLGFEGVRMVAIDEDWSALRFRKAENIKTMTRSFAMSDKGKEKVAKTSKKKLKK